MRPVSLLGALTAALMPPVYAACGRGSPTAGSSLSSTSSHSATSTPSPVVYRNVCYNGDLSVTGPDGTVPGWNVTHVRTVVGGGRAGRNAVRFDVAPPVVTKKLKARQSASDTSTAATMEQWLAGMDLTAHYTVRLFYNVQECSASSACSMNAYYGGTLFNSTPYFSPPALRPDLGWQEFVSSTPVAAGASLLTFEVVCLGSATAAVYIDEIFVSDQVSSADVDSVTIAYTQSASATSTPTSSSAARPSPTCPLCSPAASLTWTATCAMTGTPVDPSYGEPLSVYPYQSSSSECAAVCAQLGGCRSSAYNVDARVCNFLNLTLESHYFRATSQMVWSDNECWTCSTCT